MENTIFAIIVLFAAITAVTIFTVFITGKIRSFKKRREFNIAANKGFKRTAVRQNSPPNKLSLIERGEVGESTVAEQLKLLNPKEYKVINGLMLNTVDGKTVQIDHLIVARTGLFIIETKNIKGIIFKIDDNFWMQDYKGCVNRFYSPLKQNAGHIFAVKRLLGINNERIFHSIAVFPDDTKVEIRDDRIAHTSTLCAEIEKFTEHIMTYETIDRIYNSFCNANIDSEQNRAKHIEFVKNNTYRK